jgi:hypothetical protein
MTRTARVKTGDLAGLKPAEPSLSTLGFAVMPDKSEVLGRFDPASPGSKSHSFSIFQVNCLEPITPA